MFAQRANFVARQKERKKIREKEKKHCVLIKYICEITPVFVDEYIMFCNCVCVCEYKIGKKWWVCVFDHFICMVWIENVGCVDEWTLQNDGFTLMTDCWV